jgi:predicted esterase
MVVSAARPAAAAPAPPDRADLGIAYLRFERAVAAAAKDPATRSAVNQAFDALTGDFFAGRFDRALSRLAEIEGDLAGEADDAPARSERAFLASHRFSLEPRLGSAATTREFRVRRTALDGMARGTAPRGLLLRQGSRMIACEANSDAETVAVVVPQHAFDPGPVELVARMSALGDVVVGRASLLDSDPSEHGAGLLSRIESLAARGDVDPSTIASLRARHGLAFGSLDRGRSAGLVADPLALAASLPAEIAAAAAGGRPYAVPGDTWRIVRALGTDLPVRQFVPEGAGPFPLVVAFHGAGGDENMFFDGYGGGRLLAIARARGIAVVCPPTIPFGLSPNVLTRFLDELRKDVPFDPSRVGLVGHSLGAVTASRLTTMRPDRVNGAVCIAGFADLPQRGGAPPRRVYLAELDPLFPLAATRAVVDAAKARGEEIELVTIAHEGHTLVVGEVLDQAVDWLLARPACQSAATKPTASAPVTSPMNTGVPRSAPSESNPSPGPTK